MGLKPTSESSARALVLDLTVDEALRYAIEHAVDARGERMVVKQIAAATGIAGTRLYEFLQGTKKPWANEVARICRATGFRIPVDVINHDLGGVFVELPARAASEASVLGETSESCARFGALVKTIGEKSAGGFTRLEARQIRREAHQLIAQILATVFEVESAAGDGDTLLSSRRLA